MRTRRDTAGPRYAAALRLITKQAIINCGSVESLSKRIGVDRRSIYRWGNEESRPITILHEKILTRAAALSQDVLGEAAWADRQEAWRDL